MKKYIKPTCKCYNMELQGIIAKSGEESVPYGGRTSEGDITEGATDKRHHWGSLW
jgi:hypothetical protein